MSKWSSLHIGNTWNYIIRAIDVVMYDSNNTAMFMVELLTCTYDIISTECIKTTSMEDVSTGALEKIKNIQEVMIKPKNDMMYQDIYNCICQNTHKK